MSPSTVAAAAAATIHRGEQELPWADAGHGIELKVLMVRDDDALWIVRNRFAPGAAVQTHRHTGPVYAHTLSGAWHYLEYPEINRAGSFLFEPAGSVHTLAVPVDNTEPTDVWFQIHGVNLNLDPDGNVESITDGPGVLAAYYALCETQGLPRPNVVT
ncbi:MAG: 2,4'-dihydroxyacetophenone dioxygenase family protein [Acidimicrobiaceae bacterium]|nr:2,4'-dihydroxyacetophenone dioxygenase family protein [Acidimicrobiaceae bacterium]